MDVGTDKRFLENRGGELTRDDKDYNIKRIWDHHEQIINALVATNGKFTNIEIAQLVGCTPQTVSNVRNDPIIRRKIESMQKQANADAIDISKKVREMFPLASKVLTNVMKLAETEEQVADLDPRIISQAVRSANTIIDHAHPKVADIAPQRNFISLTQINEIKRNVRGDQEIAEAEYKEMA